MDYPVTGVHHITLCADTAQEDIDFCTSVMGQRLIKQTILFDGRYAHYHLYYANAAAEPGSVMTTFPYARVKGKRGSGQIEATVYTVPKGTIKFWADQLKKHNVDNDGIQERFGTPYLRFKHPSGLQFEVIEEANDKRLPWVTPEVSKDVAMRGFLGAVFSVREIPETERFLTEAIGMKKVGQDGAYHRYVIGAGGAAKTIDLLHEPDRPAGSWIFAAGMGHHLAFNVADDDALAAQKAIYEELGYTDCSEIKDRNYFHSIYCRSPGGILVECAATAPGGFSRDEPYSELGQHLLLPPWFEERRDEIVKMLEPITIPEFNGPVAQSGLGSSASKREKADFVKPQ